MRAYDVTGLRAEIVRPGVNLTVWAAQHLPYAVCNACLYDRARVPIGTIIEGGKIIHDSGNGFGCGVTWQSGELRFGSPWDLPWKSFLTGYNSPVQDGRYVAPTWRDSYVFDCRLSRIGIGQKAGRLYIVTDDLATLKEFAEHAIAQGFETLINLDGGGSRHLWYDGKTIYSSPRTPYNAIAFYKNTSSGADAPHSPQGEGKKVCPYPVPTRNLLFGCKGEDVKWLQWQLARHGFDCDVDGVFGWQTWRALWNYQKTWTRPDGICGTLTRKELIKA